MTCPRCRAKLSNENRYAPDGCEECSLLEQAPCCGELTDPQWLVRCAYCERLACGACLVEVAGKQVCIEPDCQAAAKAALVQDIPAAELAALLKARRAA